MSDLASRVSAFLGALLGVPSTASSSGPGSEPARGPTNAAGTALPEYARADRPPVPLTEVRHPDGRMTRYPPPELWDDWVEWDAKAWPRKVPRRYTLVPTICFNCESACGLLAYVDKQTLEV